jgi:hypothetical protein
MGKFVNPKIIQAFVARNVKRNTNDIYALGDNGRLYQIQWYKEDSSWIGTWHQLPPLPEDYVEGSATPTINPPSDPSGDPDSDDDIPF